MIKRCIGISIILLFTPLASSMNPTRVAIRALFQKERLRRLQAALKDDNTIAARTLIKQLEAVKKAREIDEPKKYDIKKQPKYTPYAGEHVGC